MVRETLKDLSPEELLAPPRPHIAWLVWHLSRVQDANFSGLMERPQLWIGDGWHMRFNMPPDPKDYGSGHRHTATQVEAFTVADKQPLLDYLEAVFARTKTYLATVSNDDLNRVLNEPQYQTAAKTPITRMISEMIFHHIFRLCTAATDSDTIFRSTATGCQNCFS